MGEPSSHIRSSLRCPIDAAHRSDVKVPGLTADMKRIFAAWLTNLIHRQGDEIHEHDFRHRPLPAIALDGSSYDGLLGYRVELPQVSVLA